MESSQLECNLVTQSPMKDVEGRVAFVTGGDSGIGLGITHALINAGVKVAITYRTKANLDNALDTLCSSKKNLLPMNVDVADRAAMALAAEEVVRHFGRVHILINNAGVAPMTPLCNATYDDFDWCMSVNFNGVFNGIHAFLPHIRSHGEGGQIVSTASMIGGLVVGPFWGVYSASKFAVVGMMEALRSELSHTNIGVSLFCPAGVKSNIGSSERNRPDMFSNIGSPNSDTLRLIEKFSTEMQEVMSRETERSPFMDALEAGERVVRGIRNNDLYIISHSEYENVLRDRCEALIASIPNEQGVLSEGRLAIARITRNPIYVHELRRKITQLRITPFN